MEDIGKIATQLQGSTTTSQPEAAASPVAPPAQPPTSAVPPPSVESISAAASPPQPPALPTPTEPVSAVPGGGGAAHAELLPCSQTTFNLLIKMKTYLNLINVLRNTSTGQTILQEKNKTIDLADRNEINAQLEKMEPLLTELEICIINLFSKMEPGKECDEQKLNEILGKISAANKPDTAIICNTIDQTFLRKNQPIPSNNQSIKHNHSLPQAYFAEESQDLLQSQEGLINLKTAIRHHIINQHKLFFEQYDISLLNKNLSNTSAQRISYMIQKMLDNLISDPEDPEDGAVRLERKCVNSSPGREGIQELISTEIGKYIGVAGSIPVWFKNDESFGEILRTIAKYNDHIDDKGQVKPLEKLFLRNPFKPITETFDNAAVDDRDPHQKRLSLIANMLMISAWYEGEENPLGVYFSETINSTDNTVRIQHKNTRFRHRKQMKLLRQYAEQLAFYPQDDAEAIKKAHIVIEDVLKSLDDLFRLKPSRVGNELIKLALHFGADANNKYFKCEGNARIDPLGREIFDYKIKPEDSLEILKLQIMQKLMKIYSGYHAVTSKRTRVTTLHFKNDEIWQVEDTIRYIYNTPLKDLIAECHVLPEAEQNLEGIIRYKLGSIMDASSAQGLSGEVHAKACAYLDKVFHSAEQKEHTLPRNEALRPSNSVCSFEVLAARLLAIANAYCDSNLANELNLKVNKGANGHVNRITELSISVVQLYLDDTTPPNIKVEKLRTKMAEVATAIKGNFFTGSPNSRLRLSLLELLDDSNIAVHKNEHKKSLPFNAEQSMKVFPNNNADKAKHFIHRHIISQVSNHFNHFQRDIEGRVLNKPGYYQDRAVSDIKQGLNKLACMTLAEQQAALHSLNVEQRIKLELDEEAPHKVNIRDLIMNIISKPIVCCAQIADCFYEQPIMNTLQLACDTLNKFVPKPANQADALQNNPTNKISDVEAMLLAPNQIKRCLHRVIEDDVSIDKSKLVLLANVHVLCGFYLGKNLGNQYADCMGVAHNNRLGWKQQAEELFLLASQLYLKHANAGPGQLAEDHQKADMRMILNKMNKILHDIKTSSYANSHFATELSFLVDKFGKRHELGINPTHRIKDGDKKYKETGNFLNLYFSKYQAEDIMQMFIIDETASEYSKLKSEQNKESTVPYSEHEALLQSENNLNNLYISQLHQRQHTINQIEPKNIVNLIEIEKRRAIPYDFFSPNSYLRKCKVNKANEHSTHYLNSIKRVVQPEHPAPVVQASAPPVLVR